MANSQSSFMNTCSFVLVILWVLSIPVLPVIAIWKYVVGDKQFSIITLITWVIFSVAYYFFLKAHRKAEKAMEIQREIENQKLRQKHLAERKANGIMKLDDRYVLVDSSNWDSKWNDRPGFVDWLEDEIQQLQPDDKVYHYKFGHGMGLRIGYVIVRKGKVVANALEIMS